MLKWKVAVLVFLLLVSSCFSELTVKGYSEGDSTPQNVSWKYLTENTTGLVGYWKFNEGTGTNASDSSGNGNHGAIDGASWVDGKYGKALSFDGTNDKVTIPNDSSITFTNQDFSLAFWFKSAENKDQIPLSKGLYATEGWFIYVEATPAIYLRLNKAGTTQKLARVTGFPVIGTWEYIVFIRSGSSVSLYRNGVFQRTEATAWNDMATSTSDLLIGDYNGGGYNVHGIIDDVRVYNRALNETEITSLYENNYILEGSFNGSSSSSAYYWDFGDYQNFKYDFSYTFPNETLQRSLNCTYPKSQTLANLTVYPYDLVLDAGNYTISSFNSTFNMISLNQTCLAIYGNNYRIFTEVIPTIDYTWVMLVLWAIFLVFSFWKNEKLFKAVAGIVGIFLGIMFLGTTIETVTWMGAIMVLINLFILGYALLYDRR